MSVTVRPVGRINLNNMVGGPFHRLEAGTLLHNTGSQRVPERNGFTRFGVVPSTCL